MSDAEQEHGLTYGVGQILVAHNRLWHSRKARELVDHAFDVIDLSHDGVGALLENSVAFGDDVAVFAAQPLCRKLDRRQRILDLVGDPPGDVRPCRSPLRHYQFGNVVDSDDVTVVGIRRLLAGDPYREIALLAIAVERNLPLYEPLVTASCDLEYFGKFGADFA